jgi:hypothetical protein
MIDTSNGFYIVYIGFDEFGVAEMVTIDLLAEL